MQIKGNMKYLLIIIVVMLVVFVAGATVITLVDSMFSTKQVEYSDVVVGDKYLSNDSQHYYVIVSKDGSIFDIKNFTDSDDIYDHLKVGNKYRFVTQKSQDDKYIHIVQVFNDTN